MLFALSQNQMLKFVKCKLPSPQIRENKSKSDIPYNRADLHNLRNSQRAPIIAN